MSSIFITYVLLQSLRRFPKDIGGQSLLQNHDFNGITKEQKCYRSTRRSTGKTNVTSFSNQNKGVYFIFWGFGVGIAIRFTNRVFERNDKYFV